MPEREANWTRKEDERVERGFTFGRLLSEIS